MTVAAAAFGFLSSIAVVSNCIATATGFVAYAVATGLYIEAGGFGR